jgi:hypothetical protein
MLQGFYRDLFDRKIDANDEWQYGMVETRGEGGINGGISGDQDGSSRVSIYAAVDDLQTYLDKAERQGARVVMPVTEVSSNTGSGVSPSSRTLGSETRHSMTQGRRAASALPRCQSLQRLDLGRV